MKLLFILCLFPLSSFAQGLLFKEIYAPKAPASFEVRHRQATSTWNPRYGDLSKTDVNLTSNSFDCSSQSSESECRYRVSAGHELQRFSEAPQFGDTLENPQFSGLLEVKGKRRFLSELGVNSPSDKPFNSIHETNISFTAAMAPNKDLRRSKESYWLYFLNYSNTRSFLPNIPLPGFSYTIPYESGWILSLGAPFVTLSYFDFPRWSFRVMGGPYFYSTELSYGPPFFQAGISSSLRQDSYFVAERDMRSERLFLNEHDVSFLLKHPITKTVSLEWKASYFLSQKFRYGESFDDKSRPDENLGSSVAIAVNVKARLDSLVNQ